MKMKIEMEMTKSDIVMGLTMGALMIYVLSRAYSSAVKKKKKENGNKSIAYQE